MKKTSEKKIAENGNALNGDKSKKKKSPAQMTVDELIENFTAEELHQMAWERTYQNHQKENDLPKCS